MTGGCDYHDEEKTVPANGGAAWMLTFADLISLLLTFFVMLYAMSAVDANRWKAVRAALSHSEIAPDAPVTAPPLAQYNIAATFRDRAINLDYLHAVIAQTVAADPALKGVELHALSDRLIISLPGDLLFAPGSAEIEGRAERAVFELSGLLRNISNQIGVAGHTDPAAPGRGYSSNWELSLGRAAAVANALKQAGYGRDIAVYGAGESRFGELGGVPEARRNEVARRVDIFVLPAAGVGG